MFNILDILPIFQFNKTNQKAISNDFDLFHNVNFSCTCLSSNYINFRNMEIKNLHPKWGFMQVGLELVTSSVCKSQLQFQQTNIFQLFVLNFTKIFSISSYYWQTAYYFSTFIKPCFFPASVADDLKK